MSKKKPDIKYWKHFFGKDHKELPAYPKKLSYRGQQLTDEGLSYILMFVKGVDQLDLDETEITNAAIDSLILLEYVKELRLKGNAEIDDGVVDKLCLVKGLELLHLGGTSVSLNAAAKFAACAKLKTLLISAPKDTPIAEMVALRKTMPGCEVIINYRTDQDNL